MKNFLLGTVGCVALLIAAPAVAADLPALSYKAPGIVAASYDWSGFYIGINGGGAWTRNCWAAEGCHSPTGGMAGGQLGYRLQSSSWVFGVEFQGDWSSLKGSNTSLANPAATDQSKIDGFGLLTGQVGYAWNSVLGYVKGGAALTADRYNGLNTGTTTVFDKSGEARWGGAVGAGIEYSFAPNWSVAAEYDHLFMGSRNINLIATGALAPNVPAGTLSRSDTIRQDADLATVHVNYRWGGPVISKY